MSLHAMVIRGGAFPRTSVLAVAGWCALRFALPGLADTSSDRQASLSVPVQASGDSKNIMYRLPPTRHLKADSNWKPISVVIPPKLIAANSQIDVSSKTTGQVTPGAHASEAKRKADLNKQLADATADFHKELEREFKSPPRELPKPEIAQAPAPIEPAKVLDAYVMPVPLDVTPTVEHAEPIVDAVALAPAPSELTVRMLPSIRQAYVLGQRGALFAARAEFVTVLRRVATAKDIEEGTDAYSRALSDGLRALDEADDLMPGGTQLTDMDLAVVVSSHRTPVMKETNASVLPYQAAVLYHEYAERKLGEAVAGEQAGSMALHGLGKIYSREAEETPENQSVVRNSMTMYQAALLAHPENHLAANELGVLLARNGHPDRAADMFQHVIELAPNATAYHNLAVVQQKAGHTAVAAANEERAQAYAHWENSNGEVSRRKGIRWVSPEQMAQAGSAEAPAPIAQTSKPTAANPPRHGQNVRPPVSRMANANAAQPNQGQLAVPPDDSPSTWQKFVNVATFGKLRTANNETTPMGPMPNRSVRAHGHTSAGTMLR